jgi:DNA modification methylase
MTDHYSPNGSSAKSFEVAGQTVYLQDSRDMAEVPDASVQFFMTSPPYWDLKDYGSSHEIGQASYYKYLDDLEKVWSGCYRCARRNAVLVVNVNSRRVKKRFYPIAFDIASRMTGWRKANACTRLGPVSEA